MERAWPYDLDCCKLCEKAPDEVDYKARGLCGACFKRVQYKGHLRDYCRYPEDRMRTFDGRRTASGDCLCVGDEDVRDWLNSYIPIQYKERLSAMKKAIAEEVYEFRYPNYEIDPWDHRGDNFYGTSF